MAINHGWNQKFTNKAKIKIKSIVQSLIMQIFEFLSYRNGNQMWLTQQR